MHLRNSHSDLQQCIYQSIQRLLEGSKYFKEFPAYSCSCVGKNFVFSREWDIEYKEYFSHHLCGIEIGWDLVGRAAERSETLTPEEKDHFKAILKEIPIIDMVPHIRRISVFINEKNIGYVDLTPFNLISDVYLAPPSWMKPPKYFLTCSKTYIPETTIRHKEDEIDKIDCVPYISVNPNVGVCAQHAVRMVLSILSPKAPTVPEVVSEASKTTLHGGIDRQSEAGWDAEEIHHFLEFNKYGVFHYNKKDPLVCENCGHAISDLKMSPTIENIYAYVESGIPVLLGINSTQYLNWWPDNDSGLAHALVAIGHTLDEQGNVKGLIVHDESTFPYQILEEPLKEDKTIEDIIQDAIVPVPREVTIEYQVAKQLATGFVESGSGDLNENDVIRPILTDANQAKKWLGEGTKRTHLDEYNLPVGVRDDMLEAYFDRYVWLFEFRKEHGEGHREYIGDVIVSATKPKILATVLPQIRQYVFRNKDGEAIQKNFD